MSAGDSVGPHATVMILQEPWYVSSAACLAFKTGCSTADRCLHSRPGALRAPTAGPARAAAAVSDTVVTEPPGTATSKGEVPGEGRDDAGSLPKSTAYPFTKLEAKWQVQLHARAYLYILPGPLRCTCCFVWLCKACARGLCLNTCNLHVHAVLEYTYGAAISLTCLVD